ncbi:MAG TPA: secretin N-terminal domain-containing protein, partial [Phycisphaerales bacterium]|nr:secretin N-terminal domain-containing protein [Phycisphaerales bacterium]
ADGAAVRSLVRALDAAPAYPEQHVEIVRLKAAAAPTVAAALEGLLRPRPGEAPTGPAAALVEQVRRLNIHRGGAGDGELGLDLSRPIRVLPEAQTNSLVVASTRGNVAALRELIGMLDQLPIGDAVAVRFFPLKNASAQRLAAVVRDLFTQGDRIRQAPGSNVRAQPTTEVGKALIGQVAVSVDDRTNAIIVAGREEAVALVEILIGELDTDRAASWVEPRIIPLKHADATRLARTLRQVLVEGVRENPESAAMQRQIARIRVAQAGGARAPGGNPAIEADLFTPLSTLVILPEEHLNALLVLGSPANAAAVAELVALLDVPAAAAGNTVRVFPLRYAAADRIGAMLRDIFRQQVASEAIGPEDDLVIASDPRTNTLVISTSPRSFGVVEKLLQQLDGQNIDPTVGLHVLPVTDGNAVALAPKIEQLVRERIDSVTRAGSVRAPSDSFSVQADPATNSLIVVASEENLRMVRDLLEVLSRGAQALAASEVIEVIPLGVLQAEQVLPSVQDLYVQKQNQQRGPDAVRVTPHARLNALVVRGTAEDARAIAELVRRLESQPITTVTEIRRIELRRAEATEVVRLLQNVLAGRGIGGGRVGGRQAMLFRFAREELAGQGRPEPTEAEISGVIQEQVTLTAEPRTNSVVVVAPARMMALIEELIRDIDTTVAGARSIEIFRLKNADARAMADVLRDLFNLRQQGNTLVLVPGTGQPEEPGEPGELGVTGAAGPPAPGGGSVNNLYAIPDERQQLAITIDARTNSLLVSATPEYLEEVSKVVRQLDAVEANEREQLVYELRNAKAAEVAGTLREYFQSEAETLRATLGPDRAGSLLRLLEREVTVQGDAKSNRLLVGVSPRYR